MTNDELNFFEFLSSLNKDQMRKYIAMLGSEEVEYVYQVVNSVKEQLNLSIAKLDDVKDLDIANKILKTFTLNGNVK